MRCRNPEGIYEYESGMVQSRRLQIIYGGFGTMFDTDEAAAEPEFQFDEDGNILEPEFEFDEDGNPIDPRDCYQETHDFEFDEDGNPIDPFDY